MKVTTISAGYTRKFNLGDYNSAETCITLWAQLEDGDDEAECATALRDMARNHVMTEAARLFLKLEAQVNDVLTGLPVELRSQFEIAEAKESE